MNVNSTKLSNSKDPSTVVSKYFSSNRVMDESLTDFKEKKSATKGPKTIERSSKLKKKSSKQIKGQKDIRTALKGNQSELVDYTKQFDNVCKLSGLDVETEQLLLAVALSKSLQKTDHTTDTPCTSQSSQGRIGKIRTTLQEYGFTVPEIKISKKSRVSRKKYKLLLSTEDEKQQIISDKYAQVLFDVCNYKSEEECDRLNDSDLYYKATNISYMEIKDNNVFYVDCLVEKSTSTGSLLRSWSDIPGRPSSPISCDNLNMDFSEIECSQEEVDIILSGSLKSTKSIMRNKASKRSFTAPVTIIVDEYDENNKVKYDLNNKNCSQNQNSEATLSKVRNFFNEETESITSNQRSSATSSSSSVIDKNSLTTHSKTRSCSPDIFDDEASGILENSEENKDIVYTQIIDSIIEDKNKTFHSIDLTQNTDVTSKTLKCSQNNNFTRRHSNDVMEITECVATSALSKINVNDHAKKSPGIYLSNSLSQQFQISNETKILNDNMEITDCVANNSKLSGNVPVKSNIDLTQDSDGENEIAVSECHNVSNISHTSNSDDDLPSINVKSSNNESLDATIILNNDEIDSALRIRPQVATFDNYQNKTSHRQELNNLKNDSNKVAEADELKASQSFFDEFEHDHSDNTVEKSENSKSVEYEDCGEEKNNIDLTQSSDDAIECLSVEEFNAIDLDLRSLGKRDEVSIDYDELCDNDQHKGEDGLSDACNISQQSIATNIINDSDNLTNSKSTSETSNQNSVVFEICDQELNYSINKSRCEVPWDNFGGISIMDDVSKSENSTNAAIDLKTKASESCSSMLKSMSDSFLPMVAIKSTTAEDVHIEKVPISTPLNSCSKTKKDSLKTPVSILSSEYIIKTDQVTPILDYASMSTPERNKELDKYGLKPFKRKRAVQILTHLYNQTHPLVESSDDMPSPSKRRKHDQKSPKKCLSSPKKNVPVCNKENNLYSVTKDLPDISAIECLEEDWVFQKREKAKIPSCRVPLHIAFHNYVSCRRLLREAILRYEPVNIDDIHKGLVAIGFRYDPKDLLKFMDKKCITVKTADNNARNNKR